MIHARTLVVALTVSLAACSSPQHKSPKPNLIVDQAVPRENPFYKESTLPFQAPDFTKIADAD